jgi:ubiquitin C-terminal hydrolase
MPLEMFHYRLTSVVTHEGKLDNGHYWACVNSGHEWFLMDDEKGQAARETGSRSPVTLMSRCRT